MTPPNLLRNKAEAQRIESGIEVKGEFDCKLEKPEWFDQELWEQGRAFYHEYSHGTAVSSLISLIFGLSFERLLNILVWTNESDTKKKSFWRYLDTANHVNLWFTSDVFEVGSAGNKSIRMIRQVHKGVRNRANKELNSGDGPRKEHLSQTDLAHTLIGFVGPILLTPQMFGIPEGVDMAGFIHYWKVLGYLHGIKDDFNPFSNDLVLTRATIAEVSASCMVPKLHSPPPMFDKMSQAICDWAGPRNVLFTYGLECMEPFAERNFDSKELEMYRDLRKRFQVRTLYERFRLAVTHAVWYLYPKVWLLRKFLNWSTVFVMKRLLARRERQKSLKKSN